MYGRLHERKLKEEDYIMSCQKARVELDQYIDLQAKRVNVDSAKKRAVLQHMDYQGFRQMVLGANIFPTKTQQLYNFSKGKNVQTSQNKLFNNEDKQILQKSQIQKQIKILQLKVQGKSQLECNSFREFKKMFNKYYLSELNNQNSEQLYNLIKNQSQQRLLKIFNIECEANILAKIANLFKYVIKYLRQANQKELVIKQAAFMIKFLEYILKLKTMQMNLTILSKKQKKCIIQILEQAVTLIKSDNQEQDKKDQNLINQLIKILQK